MATKRYSELERLDTFNERFDYLKLYGSVGRATFGVERYLNQRFYTSAEWRHARRIVIARDYGNDLGVNGIGIRGKILVHHMNPITPEDIRKGRVDILNPEFLISVSLDTHNDIHFGRQRQEAQDWSPRTPGDTKLW